MKFVQQKNQWIDPPGWHPSVMCWNRCTSRCQCVGVLCHEIYLHVVVETVENLIKHDLFVIFDITGHPSSLSIYWKLIELRENNVKNDHSVAAPQMKINFFPWKYGGFCAFICCCVLAHISYSIHWVQNFGNHNISCSSCFIIISYRGSFKYTKNFQQINFLPLIFQHDEKIKQLLGESQFQRFWRVERKGTKVLRQECGRRKGFDFSVI